MRTQLSTLPAPVSSSIQYESLRRLADLQSSALRRASQVAEGFDYAIAHDLRSPLRAVASTASILLEELGSDLCEEHRYLLRRQVFNATRLGELIDDLLEYSRLSRAEVRRKPCDVTALLRQIDAETDVQEGMKVAADPNLLYEALQCLVDNARKFSGKAPRVRQRDGILFVCDDGPGFEMVYAERIFRPFERLVGEETPGTGIGLAKVRRIAERHGGRAWATCTPESGTMVCINF